MNSDQGDPSEQKPGLRASLGPFLRRLLLVPSLDMPLQAFVIRLILAVLLSVGLWVRVSATEDPVRDYTYTNVRVVAHYPPSYYPIQGVPTVSVHVQGLASDLSSQVHPYGEVTLTKVTSTSTSQTVPVHVRGLSPRVRLVSVTPSHVTLQLDSARTKKIRVVVQPINTPAGYEVRGLSAAPTYVTVTGPSRVVRTILQARVVIDESGLTHSETLEVRPSIYSGSGALISENVVQVHPAYVAVTAVVQPLPVQRLISVIPRIVGSVAPGYRIAGIRVDPPLLRVVSTHHVAEGTTLSTEAITVTGWTSSHILLPSVQVPSGLTVRGPAHVTVAVSVVPVDGSATAIANLGITGLAPGYSATPSVTSVLVAYQGPVDSLDEVPVATIDVSHLKQGSYYVKPTVTLAPGLQLIGTTPPRVHVIVLRPGG